jgi:hypothetical protein
MLISLYAGRLVWGGLPLDHGHRVRTLLALARVGGLPELPEATEPPGIRDLIVACTRQDPGARPSFAEVEGVLRVEGAKLTSSSGSSTSSQAVPAQAASEAGTGARSRMGPAGTSGRPYSVTTGMAWDAGITGVGIASGSVKGVAQARGSSSERASLRGVAATGSSTSGAVPAGGRLSGGPPASEGVLRLSSFEPEVIAVAVAGAAWEAPGRHDVSIDMERRAPVAVDSPGPQVALLPVSSTSPMQVSAGATGSGSRPEECHDGNASDTDGHMEATPSQAASSSLLSESTATTVTSAPLPLPVPLSEPEPEADALGTRPCVSESLVAFRAEARRGPSLDGASGPSDAAASGSGLLGDVTVQPVEP